MSNFVAVVPPMAFETLWYPKRLLLMFDKLALDLNYGLNGYENFVLKKADHEIKWLADNELVTTLSGLYASNRPDKKYSSRMKSEGSFFLPSDIKEDFERFMDSPASSELGGNNDLRYTASDLRSLKGLDAVAVCTPKNDINIDAPVSRSSVVRITLTEFPMPADNVPWENILEYKSDDSNRSKFQNLKVWMNKASKKEISEYEYKDELRELMYSYEESLRLAKMKLQKGALEVVLTTTAEVADSLLRFNFSKLSKSLFRMSEQKIKLLEEENSLEGKEIAYIVDAKNKFS